MEITPLILVTTVLPPKDTVADKLQLNWPGMPYA